MDTNEKKDRLQKQKDVVMSNSAANNIKKFLAKNSEICDKARNYYYDYEDNPERFHNMLDVVSDEQLQELLSNITILVLTANPIENGVFIHWLYDKSGTPIATFHVNGVYYHICNILNKTIVHVHQYRTGEEFTRCTLNKIRKVICPKYVFMLGICYGLGDMTLYPIGTVFASNSIKSYRINFREEFNTGDVIFQAEEEYYIQPNKVLIDFVQGCLMHKQTRSILPDLPNIIIARALVGQFLSSNCLMDHRIVKNAILEQVGTITKPLGGEMEGAGIIKSYLVEEEGFVNWMLIKSICDWGEKKNSLEEDPSENKKIKESLQAFAMSNTCGAFENILKDLH